MVSALDWFVIQVIFVISNTKNNTDTTKEDSKNGYLAKQRSDRYNYWIR